MKAYFGEFGGRFVPELLMPPLLEVERAMEEIVPQKEFQDELEELLNDFAGRPTPLTYCPALSAQLGFNLWLKREDLLHTGAHKINNTLGQALLAKKWAKQPLLRKLAPASTAWLRQRRLPGLGWSAKFSWAPKM